MKCVIPSRYNAKCTSNRLDKRRSTEDTPLVLAAMTINGHLDTVVLDNGDLDNVGLDNEHLDNNADALRGYGEHESKHLPTYLEAVNAKNQSLG